MYFLQSWNNPILEYNPFFWFPTPPWRYQVPYSTLEISGSLLHPGDIRFPSLPWRYQVPYYSTQEISGSLLRPGDIRFPSLPWRYQVFYSTLEISGSLVNPGEIKFLTPPWRYPPWGPETSKKIFNLKTERKQIFYYKVFLLYWKKTRIKTLKISFCLFECGLVLKYWLLEIDKTQN